MKENLPMFGVLNYVFVAVTQFESLNGTILEKFWVAQEKWKLTMSASKYSQQLGPNGCQVL